MKLERDKRERLTRRLVRVIDEWHSDEFDEMDHLTDIHFGLDFTHIHVQTARLNAMPTRFTVTIKNTE